MFINQLRVIFGENADILVQPLNAYYAGVRPIQHKNGALKSESSHNPLYQNADELNAFAQINFSGIRHNGEIYLPIFILNLRKSTAILAGEFDQMWIYTIEYQLYNIAWRLHSNRCTTVLGQQV